MRSWCAALPTCISADWECGETRQRHFNSGRSWRISVTTKRKTWWAIFTSTGLAPIATQEKQSSPLFDQPKQGNKNAMSELALYYSLGFIGCCPDEQKAIYWTQRLAALGDVYAEIDLMRAYSRGAGVPKNEGQAVDWARRAAEQDSVEAYLFLGDATEQGRGTDKDLLEAYKWFNLATAHANATEAAEAARRRDEIAAMLNAEQLREAKRLSLEWPLRRRLR